MMEEHNWKLKRKYQEIEKNEVRLETFMLDDAAIAVVAFGSAARIAKGAIKRVRREGIKAGLIRPITLWPFPYSAIHETVTRIKHFIVFELNTGQMVEDVKMALAGKGEIYFYGRPGGPIPTPLELAKVISSRYTQKLGRVER